MKSINKFLVAVPLLGFAITGCQKQAAPPQTTVAEPSFVQKTEMAVKTAADKTKDAALDLKDAVSEKLTEWKLTPADIKTDLEKGGRVVRSKATSAGAKAGMMFDNAKVVTVINAKLVADAQLSALKINVDAANGIVTLKGTVKSPELIGRAVVLALDTNDVSQVVSLLSVEMP